MTTRHNRKIMWPASDPGIGHVCARCGHVGTKENPVFWTRGQFNAAAGRIVPPHYHCTMGWDCRARVAEKRKEAIAGREMTHEQMLDASERANYGLE